MLVEKIVDRFSESRCIRDKGELLKFCIATLRSDSLTVLIAILLLFGLSSARAGEAGADFNLRLGVDRADVQNMQNCHAAPARFLSGGIYRERPSAASKVSCADMAYKVFGGIDYNRDLFMVGGEIGYWSANGVIGARREKEAPASLSGSEAKNGSTDTDTFYYGLRLGLNFWHRRLTPYVTGGLHSRKLNALWDATVSGRSILDGTDPYYGLGIEYDFWPLRGLGTFSLHGKWERFSFDSAGDVDFYGMSVLYEFDL